MFIENSTENKITRSNPQNRITLLRLNQNIYTFHADKHTDLKLQ
jgi:hypothetical protein